MGVKSGANSNVIVTVERWLKWDGLSSTTQARIDVPAGVLTDWKTRGSRLLIFNHMAEDVERAIDLSDPGLQVLTADMNVLRDPGSIAQRTQEVVARHAGVYGIYTFRRGVPTLTIHLMNAPDGLTTTVPADSDLEHWALNGIDSPVASERAEGARAHVLSLERERSPAEIAARCANSGTPPDQMLVRQTALYALRFWGLKVPESVSRK